MASQSTTIHANQVGTGTAGAENAVYDYHGRVRCISDSYTTTSAVATTETLSLCKLPIGAKVLKIELFVPASAGPTGQSLLGITGDTDKFGRMNNINAAAGIYTAVPQTATDLDNAPSTTTEETVLFTPVGASLATALLINFAVYYVVD